MALMAGTDWALALLVGSDGRGYLTKRVSDGLAYWPDAIFTDMLVELNSVRSPGGVSTTAVTCGTGAKTFPLVATANFSAGIWVAYSYSNPGDYMVCTLATSQVGVNSVTLQSQIAPTANTRSDWVIVPAAFKRRAIATKTADYAIAGTDLGAVIVMNSASAHIITLPAYTALGFGFEGVIRNRGAGTLTVTPDAGDSLDGGSAGASITLAQGQSISWLVEAANLISITSSKGYGASPWTWDAVQSGAGNYQAVKGRAIPCDATANDIPILTPVTPAHGDEFRIRDSKNNSGAAHFITLKYDGVNKVMRSAVDHKLDVAGLDWDKVYTFITGEGWL